MCTINEINTVLFTQPAQAFNATFAEHHKEFMACYAEVFCKPAFVGAVIAPGLFQIPAATTSTAATSEKGSVNTISGE